MSTFPTGAELLVLQAALAGPEEAAQAWRRWKSEGHSVDAALSPVQLLLPLVYHNLHTTEVLGADANILKGVRRYHMVRNGFLEQAGAAVLRSLQAEPLLLDLRRYYAGPGLRPQDRLDVLLRPEAHGLALERARLAGFTMGNAQSNGTEVTDAAAHRLFLAKQGLLECWWRDADQGFWDRSRPGSSLDVPVRVLDDTDALLLACVGCMRPWVGTFHWVADAVTIMRTSSINWDTLFEEAQARRLVACLRAALWFIVKHFDAPVPQERLQRLSATWPDRLYFQARLGGGWWRFLSPYIEHRREPKSPGFLSHLRRRLRLRTRWAAVRARIGR